MDTPNKPYLKPIIKEIAPRVFDCAVEVTKGCNVSLKGFASETAGRLTKQEIKHIDYPAIGNVTIILRNILVEGKEYPLRPTECQFLSGRKTYAAGSTNYLAALFIAIGEGYGLGVHCTRSRLSVRIREYRGKILASFPLETREYGGNWSLECEVPLTDFLLCCRDWAAENAFHSTMLKLTISQLYHSDEIRLTASLRTKVGKLIRRYAETHWEKDICDRASTYKTILKKGRWLTMTQDEVLESISLIFEMVATHTKLTKIQEQKNAKERR